MPRDVYADDETLGRADQVYGQSLLSDALAGVRFHAALPAALSSVRKIADSWQPLPIVVSPRPETVQQPLTMPSVMDRPSPTPQTPTTPGSQSAAAPETTTSSAPPQAAAMPSGASGVPQAAPSGASGPAPQGGGKADRYSAQIAQVAREEGVPYDVLAGLIDTESSGEDSVSPAGARGIMQVVPGQGYDHPGENAADPLTSIRQGARAVKDKYNATGSWERAGRAYFGYGVDAGGMTTDRYGQIYDAARARYQGAPAAAAPTAAGSPSSAPAQTAPAQPSAAGSSDTVTIRSRATGATMQVPASMVGDAPGHYRSADYEVVPSPTMQKTSADMPDDTGPSAGDQKRQKMAAASGQAVEMPQHDPPFDWLPAQQVVNPPTTLDNQRTIRNVNVETGAVDGDGSPDATGAVQYRQQEGAPRPGTDQPIQNDDGSVATERSITVTEPGLNGGRATNIPTVWNGRIVSDDEAADNAIRSGVAFPSFGSVDDAVRAAEQRSRDLGAGQATSVGGASVPPEVQNALPNRNRPVRGQPIDESGGTMYRQPLQPTMGDTTTGQEQPYDSRQYDEGPHEGGQVEWNDQPNDPSSISTPAATASATPSTLPIDAASTLMSTSSGTTASATQDSLPTPTNQPSNPADDPGTAQQSAESPLKPLYDLGGQIIGYVHSGLETAGNAVLGSPEVRAERNRVLRENTRRDVGPIVEPALEAVSQGAAGIEQATGAPAGSVLQAAQDTSNFIGPGTGLLMGGIREVPRPTPQTVEALQQRLQQARSIVDRLIGAGDAERLAMAQENRAAVESALADAQNARRNLEPRIRSDVGAKEPAIPPSAETVENRMESIRPQGGPMAPEDLSGPVSIPTNTGERLNVAPGVSGSAGIAGDVANSLGGGVAGATVGAGLPADSDQERLQHGLLGAGAGMIAGPVAGRLMRRGEGGARASFGVGPNGERYDPRLSQEPVLPGFEDQAPRTRPTVRGEPGDAAAQSEMRASRSGELLDTNALIPPLQRGPNDPHPPNWSASPVDTAIQEAQQMARESAERVVSGEAALPPLPTAGANWWQRKSAENARHMAENGVEPLSPLRWLNNLAQSTVYSSLIGPSSAIANFGANLAMPVLSTPRELVRPLVRAAQTRNPDALREYPTAAWALTTDLMDVGKSMVDALAARGRFAQNPNHPMLSGMTINPAGQKLAEGLELGNRVYSALPDAIFGTLATNFGERRAAAQMATDLGLHGGDWGAVAQGIIQDVRTGRSGGTFTGPTTGELIAAIKQADEQGLKGADRQRQVGMWLQQAADVRDGQLVQNPDIANAIVKRGKEILDGISEAGTAYGDHQTFRDQLGEIGKAARKASGADLPVVGPGITPFFNTNWNVWKRLGEHTPAGPLLNRSRPTYDKAFDAAFGTLVLAGIANYATGGVVTGSGPSDPQARKDMESQGWQRYSTLVDGVYVPNRLLYGIMEGPMNMAGDWHDHVAYQKTGEAWTQKSFEDMAQRVGQQIRNAPTLTGWANVLDAMSGQGVTGKAERYASGQVTAHIPYAATARTIGTSQDTAERTIERGKDVPPDVTMGQQIAAGVGVRSGLPQNQDSLGRPKENPQQGWRALAPIMRSQKADPVIQAFTENNVEIPQPRSTLTIDGLEIPLTPKQQRDWQRYMGEYLLKEVPKTTRSTFWTRPTTTIGDRSDELHDLTKEAADDASERIQTDIGNRQINQMIRESEQKKAIERGEKVPAGR